MATARLIVEGESSPCFSRSGVENMALDEVLLKTAAEEATTSLRFYGWQPATLSLGYFQEFADVRDHVDSAACDCVRRASGGGAIVHHHELTYCFATRTRSRFGGDHSFYLAFHETLVELLREQGVDARLHSAADDRRDEPFLCFQRRASNDVIVKDFKIAGSAQRRWKNGLVQHGSLLLKRSKFAPELLGIQDLVPFSMSTSTVIRAWLKKLTSRLNLEFAPGHLTDKEITLWNHLQSEKFSTDQWTKRR